MKSGKQDAALVRKFAEEKGCSVKTAQRRRADNHPEWVKFLSALASARAAVPPAPAPEPFTLPDQAAEPVLIGLQKEIESLGKRCQAANVELDMAYKTANPALISNAIKNYTALVESYRRISKDTPGIEESNDRLIDVGAVEAVWTRAAAEVRLIIESLPASIQSLVPAESAIDVRIEVDRKIASALQSLANVQLAPAA